MSLNETPMGERIHIGFFGCRNAGKSSLLNAVTGQELAVVSDTKGTTTDPVLKAMELLPMGPVVVIDTPGYDDEGDLGALRVKKTKEVLMRTDVAVLVVDATVGMRDADRELLRLFEERKVPYIIALNKCDAAKITPSEKEIAVSALAGVGVDELKERIASLQPNREERRLVGDLLEPGDVVVLVVPIDDAAPKGRIILPQQQVIRDCLDAGAMTLVVRDSELEGALSALAKPPKMVITDSQVFEEVAKIVPEDVPLTSFSILMARYKGFLEIAVRGVKAIDALKDGDKVLVAEGCTHHRQCGDIGTVKLPMWLRKHTGADVVIETASGRGFPGDLSEYALILHCGGCMLSEREVMQRMERAGGAKVAVTNYGTAIAHMKGILRRSLSVLPWVAELLDG